MISASYSEIVEAKKEQKLSSFDKLAQEVADFLQKNEWSQCGGKKKK